MDLKDFKTLDAYAQYKFERERTNEQIESLEAEICRLKREFKRWMLRTLGFWAATALISTILYYF